MNNLVKLAICFLTALPTSVSAQRYVNEEWSSITGLPVNLNWSASLIASSGHIMTVGNTYTTGQSSNLLLTKYSSNGAIVWQVEYDNDDHLEDYGIGICEDNAGNFFVVGTSYHSGSGSLDLIVLKYNAGGQLQWTYQFNGASSGDDIPVAIRTDGSNAYVTGGTETSGGYTDYVTAKIKADGTQEWINFYDHNQLNDAAVNLEVSSNGEVIVSDGSAQQWNLYDMATVKYDASGNQVHEYRSNYNVGIDQPASFGTDGNGNTIVGGWYSPNVSEVKMSLVSLDDTLGFNWNTIHDPSAGEDKIMDIAVTLAGDIYAVGHSEPSPGQFQAFIGKFDNGGTLLWQRFYSQSDAGAFAKRITVDPSGNVNVAGMIYEATDTSILTLQYDPNGTLLLSQTYDAGGTEIASAIETDFWGNIYIHGTSDVNGNGYVTLKYATFFRDFSAADSGDYKFVDDEIIVQFKPAATNQNAFMDQGRTFGTLSSFLSANAIQEMNDLYEGAYDFGRFNAVKVFPRLTLDDTIGITRGGDTFRLHHFWTSLVIQVPGTMNEHNTAVDLNDLDDIVYFAELNLIGITADLPDDTEFAANGQLGLESSLSPDRDIEMDRAWDIFHGSNDARVGIYDSGIKWQHEDFSTTGSQSFNDTKVVNGYDYWNNAFFNPSYFGDDNGHGTKAAGIVGAIRNNNEGVAGIAGGDAEQSNYGANLLDFKILNFETSFNFSQTAVDKAAQGWIDGARGFQQNGFELDVMNNSWAIKPPNTTLYTEANKTLYFKTLKAVYDFGVTNVCSRGNNVQGGPVIPATVGPDHFLLSVGGSDNSGAAGSFSGVGRNVDIIAPGVEDLVTSTHNNLQNQPYDQFDGTSAAAAHASGVAALLISNDKYASHWPSTILEPDDVENLVERYPTDEGLPGYDDTTGWGRLNAGLVMEHMEWPYYRVEHFNGAQVEDLLDLDPVQANVAVNVKEDFDFAGTSHDVAEGTYMGTIWKRTIETTHDIGNAQLLNAWIRNGSAHSNLLANSTDVYDVPQAVLDSVTETHAYIHGYVINLWEDPQGNPINKWLPPDTAYALYGYSLHLYDSVATGMEDEKAIDLAGEFYAWPNPTGDEQTLSIPEGKNTCVELIDIQGRVCRQVYRGNSETRSHVKVDVHTLPPGVYFYRLTSDEQALIYKFIKN